jgi:L-ascorbate metabolism protein UlaG (beta-lactamase superfamily)
VTSAPKPRRRRLVLPTGKRRWLMRLGFFLLGMCGSGWLLGCCVFAAPRYRGPTSDHFDGAQFVNPLPTDHGGLPKIAKWFSSRQQGPWVEVSDAQPGPAPPQQVAKGEMRVTFVGHATVLLQLDGINVLTDPIWAERASPVGFAGPKRVRPPGIRFDDLPPIHAVVLSHNHYDHFNLHTLRRLHRRHRPRFIVGLGNGALLARAGIEGAIELDWWQNVSVPGPHGSVRVFAVPAQHFSSRGLCDRDANLWAGFVLRGSAGAAYFAGDTGMGPHFEQIRKRFGDLRLAMLPIGAYKPRWFMKDVHVSPAEAVAAHRLLGATTSMAIHFGTFPLGDDGQHEAVGDLDAALKDAGLTREQFWVVDFGEGRSVPSLGARTQ